MKFTLYSALFVGLIVCFSIGVTAEKSAELAGSWTLVQYDRDTRTYARVSDLDAAQPGIRFMEDGTLSKKQNAGGCGTPPIT